MPREMTSRPDALASLLRTLAADKDRLVATWAEKLAEHGEFADDRADEEQATGVQGRVRRAGGSRG